MFLMPLPMNLGFFVLVKFSTKASARLRNCNIRWNKNLKWPKKLAQIEWKIYMCGTQKFSNFSFHSITALSNFIFLSLMISVALIWSNPQSLIFEIMTSHSAWNVEILHSWLPPWIWIGFFRIASVVSIIIFRVLFVSFLYCGTYHVKQLTAFYFVFWWRHRFLFSKWGLSKRCAYFCFCL